MGSVFDPRVFSADTHNAVGETDAEAEEREARERAKRAEARREATRASVG